MYCLLNHYVYKINLIDTLLYVYSKDEMKFFRIFDLLMYCTKSKLELKLIFFVFLSSYFLNSRGFFRFFFLIFYVNKYKQLYE